MATVKSISNMKTIAAIICLAATVLAEAPFERPSVYYVVAPRIFEEAVDVGQVSEETMAKLKQIQGSDSGFYHVYLPDGRLQKVQYTTAPVNTNEELKSEEAPKKSYVPVFKGVKVIPLPLAKASEDDTEKEAEKSKEDYKQEAPASGYVASITYSDVAPIPGPIYSYNPKPLVRAVRYAPRFN